MSDTRKKSPSIDNEDALAEQIADDIPSRKIKIAREFCCVQCMVDDIYTRLIYNPKILTCDKGHEYIMDEAKFYTSNNEYCEQIEIEFTRELNTFSCTEDFSYAAISFSGGDFSDCKGVHDIRSFAKYIKRIDKLRPLG